MKWCRKEGLVEDESVLKSCADDWDLLSEKRSRLIFLKHNLNLIAELRP